MVGVALLTSLYLILIFLDISKRISLMRKLPLLGILAAVCNPVLLGYWSYEYLLAQHSANVRLGYLVSTGIFIFYIWLRLNIFPVRDGQKAGFRLKAMIGGRFLTICGFWALLIETVFLICSWSRFHQIGVPTAILTSNAVYGVCIVLFLLVNGMLRMFFTSRRLSIIRRVIMLLTFWIPAVNIFMLFYTCRVVRDEYDYALYKKDLREVRAGSDLCETKYPLVMVHGVLFRDLKYFNYWGRIPKELIRYGATVYYGNQEAVGSIEYNAEEIRQTILKVLEETGSEKVNIIAHSKGGLDSRYAISMLGMDEYVASLTCISTPHRGCRVLDFVYKLPDGFFRFLARIFNAAFRRLGDTNPDFYNAIPQFSTENSDAFNKTVLDAPGVYYQSYATKMNHILSDLLLAIPYLFIYLLEGQNDGLVSVTSAKWGEFRGVITSKGRRGVSHGDIIDLRRDDYRGFDAIETLLKIVADLKDKGF